MDTATTSAGGGGTSTISSPPHQPTITRISITEPTPQATLDDADRHLLPCRFYANGYCQKGIRCRFYHPNPLNLRNAVQVPPMPPGWVTASNVGGSTGGGRRIVIDRQQQSPLLLRRNFIGSGGGDRIYLQQQYGGGNPLLLDRGRNLRSTRSNNSLLQTTNQQRVFNNLTNQYHQVNIARRVKSRGGHPVFRSSIPYAHSNYGGGGGGYYDDGDSGGWKYYSDDELLFGNGEYEYHQVGGGEIRRNTEETIGGRVPLFIPPPQPPITMAANKSKNNLDLNINTIFKHIKWSDFLAPGQLPPVPTCVPIGDGSGDEKIKPSPHYNAATARVAAHLKNHQAQQQNEEANNVENLPEKKPSAKQELHSKLNEIAKELALNEVKKERSQDLLRFDAFMMNYSNQNQMRLFVGGGQQPNNHHHDQINQGDDGSSEERRENTNVSQQQSVTGMEAKNMEESPRNEIVEQAAAIISNSLQKEAGQGGKKEDQDDGSPN